MVDRQFEPARIGENLSLYGGRDGFAALKAHKRPASDGRPSLQHDIDQPYRRVQTPTDGRLQHRCLPEKSTMQQLLHK